MAAVTKPCTSCLQTLPLDAFSPHPNGLHGKRSKCKACNSKAAMRWRDDNPDRVLHAHLMRTFGISLEQYNEMLELQDGVCAICGDAPDVRDEDRRSQGVASRLVVDHCHQTGRVRGLLCAACNKGIGLLQDSVTVVRAALEYLGALP